MMIGALRVVTPKLGEWLQQIPGKTFDTSVQKLSRTKVRRKITPGSLNVDIFCFVFDENCIFFQNHIVLFIVCVHFIN